MAGRARHLLIICGSDLFTAAQAKFSHQRLVGLRVALAQVGQVAAALATAWLTDLLHSRAGLAEDAGTGVAFTTLFAIGVVLVTALASRIGGCPPVTPSTPCSGSVG